MQFFQIESEEQRKKLHDKYGKLGGVYKLHCLQQDSGQPVPLARLLGIDDEGILYIGKTAPGLGRIGDLIKSLSPAHISEGHHVGLRFAKNLELSKSFPFENLYVTFTPSENPTKKERVMIDEYVQKFGEVPPLNANEP